MKRETTGLSDDVYNDECKLFESALQSSNSRILLHTDLAHSCPCSSSVVDVRCEDSDPSVFPGTPTECDGVTDPQSTVLVPVCGSVDHGAGVEAYKAYCLETFESVRRSVSAQQQKFENSFTAFMETVVGLAQDQSGRNLLPTTIVQAIGHQLNTDLSQKFTESIVPNQCLDGCALFMAQSCCQDEGMTSKCTSISPSYGTPSGNAHSQTSVINYCCITSMESNDGCPTIEATMLPVN